MGKKLELNFLHGDHTHFDIVPLPAKREWMNETSEAFAYRCVPLNVANTYGWAVLNPTEFTAEWNGGTHPHDITVEYLGEGENNYIAPHFGHGVLTVSVDFVVRTDPGISLFVRGIPNTLTDGIAFLDGIVETDWLPFTFTYNYRFTKPGKVVFPKNFPLFSFFPIERGFIEGFELTSKNIEDDTEFYSDYLKYEEARSSHLENNVQGFQKFYPDGVGADGKKFDIKNHNKTTIVARPE